MKNPLRAALFCHLIAISALLPTILAAANPTSSGNRQSGMRPNMIAHNDPVRAGW